MYELLIKGASGQWERADFGNDEPAYNITSMEVGTIDTRNGDYTQALKLPITDNNSRLFGFADQPDQFRVKTPYRNLPCVLSSNGLQITDKGAFINLRGMSAKHFICQIKSGNSDFFDILINNKMSALNDETKPYFLGKYDITDEELQNNNNPDCTFAAATYLKPSDDFKTYWVHMQTGQCTPFVPVTNILDKIGLFTGYNIDYSNIAGIGNKYISICDNNSYERSFENFGGLLETDNPTRIGTGIIMNITDDAQGYLRDKVGLHCSFEYHAPVDCKIKVTSILGSGYTGIDSVTTFFWLSTSAKQFPDYTDTVPTVDNELTDSMEFELKANDYLLISADPNNYGDQFDFYFSVKIDVIEVKDNPKTPIGGTVPIATNIGFDAMNECFKAILQVLGIIVTTQADTKTVFLHNFSEIVDNYT